MSRNKTFTQSRIIINDNRVHWCRFCMRSPVDMIRVTIGNGVHHVCLECLMALTLIGQTRYGLQPDAIRNQEPELWSYCNSHMFAANVRRLYRINKRIQAIKELREKTGLGLKDAKDQCDWWVAGNEGWLHSDMQQRVIKLWTERLREKER